ncbi:SBBP repeat-containing protein [Acidobacteriota bacterium]
MSRFLGKERLMLSWPRISQRQAHGQRLPLLLRTCFSITLVIGLTCVIAPPRASAITMPGSGIPGGSTLTLWPLSFERNEGQAPEEVCFLSRADDVDLFLTENEIVLATEQSALRIQLIGTNHGLELVGLNQQAHRSNYFIGRDPTGWRTDVRHFEGVEYPSLYRGIDMFAWARQGSGWEMVFVVSPEGSPRTIRFQFSEAGSVRIEPNGDMAIDLGGGTYHIEGPIAYQEGSEGRSEVKCRYVVLKTDEIGIEVERYDRCAPLVIDPVLRYSTYLGGTESDEATSIAVDGCGNAYVVGETQSLDFPTLNPFQPQSKKAMPGCSDAFVTKFDAKGALIYSTYLGGSDSGGGPCVDRAEDVAVDVDGQVYVTGGACRPDFPVQFAWQPSFGGWCDAFVTKIDATGQRLVYSTYLGGSVGDAGNGIAIDASGNAYVVGETSGDDFPTLNALQQSWGGGPSDAFLTKLDAAGMGVYSTYLGGVWRDEAESVAVDSNGSAIVAGRTLSPDFPSQNPFQGSICGDYDAFVTKIDPAGTGYVFSTFLGGTSEDKSLGVAVDESSAAIYVVGHTSSADFPVVSAIQGALLGAEDGFVSKFDASGGLVYSSYLGGTGKDGLGGVAVDPSGNAFVIGAGDSTDYPTASPVQPASGGGYDVLVSVLVPDGSSFVYSTYLGGSASDGWGTNFRAPIAVDSFGNAYVAGITGSDDFPVDNPAQAVYAGGDWDAFVSVIDNGGGSFIPGPVGNTLMAVKNRSVPDIVFTWGDIAVATGYELYQHEIKSSPDWSLVATASTGSPPGLSISMPAEPLLFFKVAGTNCGVTGPK